MIIEIIDCPKCGEDCEAILGDITYIESCKNCGYFTVDISESYAWWKKDNSEETE